MHRARALAVFAATTAVLAALAGGDLVRPSANNHYVHLAASWLKGQLDHGGAPPGYPSAHDDWGRVTTLELRGGERLRAYRCRTPACERRRREARVEPWITLDGQHRELTRAQILRRSDAWYVTFPPAPALLMLPGVALLGLAFPDRLFTLLLAAAIPALLVALLDRRRGLGDGRAAEHLWLAAAWAVASPACFVGASGGVWFTAQIVGAFFLLVHIGAAWQARRPLLAGLALALAAASRPAIVLALPFFLLEWSRAGRRPRDLLRFAAPLALIGGLCLAFNWARFGDPFEMGHRLLDVRWQARMQSIGLFSPHYLPRNLAAMLWCWPQLSLTPPHVRLSIHGLGLLFSAPWLLVLFSARRPFPQRRGLLLAAALVMLPALFYHNTGQLQLSYRFILDALPLLLLVLADGGGLAPRRRFAALVLVAALINLYGAAQFQRAPGQLFVQDLWWPFAPDPR